MFCRFTVPPAAAVLALITALLGGIDALAIDIRTAALTGQPVPGLADGIVYGGFVNSIQLNNGGQLAFFAELSGAGVTSSNEVAIVSDGGGSGLAIVAREGEQVAGLSSGIVYDQLDYILQLNDAGDVAFNSYLSGAGVTVDSDSAIFRSKSGAPPSVVAREGEQAPGFPAANTYGNLYAPRVLPVLGEGGQIVFSPFVSRPGLSNGTAFFTDAGRASIVALAREGGQVPGMAAGVQFGVISPATPTFNASGQTAFLAPLSGVGVTSSNNEALFVDTPGVGLALLARKGQPVASIGSGAVYTGFLGHPAINDNSKAAFVSGYSGGPGGGGGQVLVHGTSSSDMSALVQSRQPAAGIGGGVNYSLFRSSSVHVNSVGEVSFVAELTGTGVNASNWLAIYSGMDGS